MSSKVLAFLVKHKYFFVALLFSILLCLGLLLYYYLPDSSSEKKVQVSVSSDSTGKNSCCNKSKSKKVDNEVIESNLFDSKKVWKKNDLDGNIVYSGSYSKMVNKHCIPHSVFLPKSIDVNKYKMKADLDERSRIIFGNQLFLRLRTISPTSFYIETEFLSYPLSNPKEREIPNKKSPSLFTCNFIKERLLVTSWNKSEKDIEYQLSKNELGVEWSSLSDIFTENVYLAKKFSSISLLDDDVVLLVEFDVSPSCKIFHFDAKTLTWSFKNISFFDSRYQDVSLVSMGQDYVVGGVLLHSSDVEFDEVILYNPKTNKTVVVAVGDFIFVLDMVWLGNRSLGISVMRSDHYIMYGYIEDIDNVNEMISLIKLDIKGSSEIGFYDGVAINVCDGFCPCVATVDCVSNEYRIMFVSAKDNKGLEWNNPVTVFKDKDKLSSLTLLYMGSSKSPYMTYINEKKEDLLLVQSDTIDGSGIWHGNQILVSVDSPEISNLRVKQGQSGIAIVHQDRESQKIFYNFMPTIPATINWSIQEKITTKF